jgi:hypothetical protein
MPRVRFHIDRIVAAANAATPGSFAEVEMFVHLLSEGVLARVKS